MKITIHEQIGNIPAVQWNSLVEDSNPFTRHEFLYALECNGCVGEAFGWLPCHITIHEDGELLGAMPLYEKYNSYGEFVFDHAWAQAWQRAGLEYYPKLVSSIPYTPASGQRLLARPEHFQQVAPVLLQTARSLLDERRASGLHILFAEAKEQDWLENAGLLVRHDCQFHWRNQGYQSFDDFLQQLSAKKRKNIKQERKRVRDSSAQLRVLDGHQATEKDWDDFATFYLRTFEEKWGMPTLNAGFFKQVASTLSDQVVLVLADHGGSCIAGSLMFRSATRLYGRHWGAIEYIDKLHFEACYYQGIEYCIANGLSLFEPGAQGEHKIARGFAPTLTRSSHWMGSNPFEQALQNFAAHEREAVRDYMQDCWQHVPYKDKPL